MILYFIEFVLLDFILRCMHNHAIKATPNFFFALRVFEAKRRHKCF